MLPAAGSGIRTLANIERYVRQRTDAGDCVREDADTIDHSREEPTVTATPTPDGAYTQGAVPDQAAAEADERCLMAELSIIRGGHWYYYDGYRYERLSDAVAYAQLVQGRTRRSSSPAAH
jgi:hypothetical protein